MIPGEEIEAPIIITKNDPPDPTKSYGRGRSRTRITQALSEMEVGDSAYFPVQTGFKRNTAYVFGYKLGFRYEVHQDVQVNDFGHRVLKGYKVYRIANVDPKSKYPKDS